MKKLKNRLISLVIILLLVSLNILAVFFLEKKEEKTTYNIVATIKDDEVHGELELLFVNEYDFNINELFFCLYPNAFKNEENIKNTTVLDRIHEAYPNGFDCGYISIIKVLINDNEVQFSLEENEQILKIKTPITKPNKKLKIKINFIDKLPNMASRFGYSKNTCNFGNWYPILCPYINGSVYKSLYTPFGDPFVSDCADYNVELTIESQYRLATSGQIIKKEIIDPIKTKWLIKGTDLRDFAFVISDKYNMQSSQKDNTHIYSYYLNNDNVGRYVVEFAEKALCIFNELFGKYQYPTLTIAESDFYIGGMEYPNLVFINTALYTEDTLEALEEVVIHEVAHQWWYNMVGNNQLEEAWLDEGLTQYSVALYYEKMYGIERYKSFLNENEIYCKVVFDILKDNNINFSKNIERKIIDFEHWVLYDAITYDVSAIMFDDLRKKIGDELFFYGLRCYFEKNKYKISSKNDFINCMKKATNKNIDGIISPWLSGNIYWG